MQTLFKTYLCLLRWQQMRFSRGNFILAGVILLAGFHYPVYLAAQPNKPVQKHFPFRLTGNLSASSTNYSISGIAPRREPFSWMTTGNLNFSIFGIDFPFSATVSDQQRAFRQPFNQYGVSPRYKWITLHAGYRSMQFSEYTLAGAIFLGAGLELKPGILRLAGMYGRFQKAVEETSARAAGLPIIPAYERWGLGAKVGLGTARTYVDLIAFKAKDDTASLRTTPSNRNIRPAENLVVGVRTRIHLAWQFQIEGEAAASALNRDIRSPEIVDENNKILAFVKNFFTPRTSVQANVAGSAAATLQISSLRLRMQYKRVEPGYRTLGAYSTSSDFENLTLSPSFDLFNRRLSLSLSMGRQRDNLNKKKLATTTRTIGSANVSWNPSAAYGIDVQYGNYSTDQRSGAQPLNDTTQVTNVSRDVTISPRVMIVSGEKTHSIFLSFSYLDFVDHNPITQSVANAQTQTASLSYTLSFSKSGTSIGATSNFTNNETGGTQSKIAGGNVSFSTQFFDRVLGWNISTGFTSNTLEGSTANYSYTGNTRLSYSLGKAGSIAFNLNYMNYQPGTSSSRSFSEVTTRLTYSTRFSF